MSSNEYKHNKDTIQLTIDFDDDNICAACNNEVKWDGTINWEDRKELQNYAKNLRT